MKILITGAGGFVGRQVSRRLLEAGHEVTGTDTHAGGILAGVRAVPGDLADRSVRGEAMVGGIDALIHLATVPGGAAEADPVASRRVNVDAMYDLLLEVAAFGQCPRVVFASSIAVFGDPLPDLVDDATPPNPKLIYGGHKAMMEQAVALFSNRGAIDGVSLRLPGILARPKGQAGMKSAFMSEIFHALAAGERFTCPVSPGGTIWAQSLHCVTDNLLAALHVPASVLPGNRALTLPALRFSMAELAEQVARQTGVSVDLVRYEPDATLEQAFATQPPLLTPAAEAAGFRHDGDIAKLVANALTTVQAR